MAVLAVSFATLTAPVQVAAQQMDSTQVERFQLADSFLRAGQFDRAITLLEDLISASPDNFAFYDKLKDAYESVKRYDDAAALVESRMGSEPDPSLLSDIARIQYLRGDERDAYAAWDDALAVRPDDPGTYRIVYQSLLDVRQFERAIDVLNQAREAVGDPSLFRPDLAYLYNLTGRHEDAAAEYLGLLESNQQQLGFVRSRLGRFIEQEEALRTSIAATERAVRSEPLHRAFRELLGWLYVEAEDFSSAFDAYRAIDRLESENGQVLFQFAQMASDASAYDVAADTYREILARYPDAPSAPQALAALGRMHEHWAEQIGERVVEGNAETAPHYRLALETYRTFLQQYPHHELYANVLRDIGRLEQDVYFDLEAAETTLRQVIAEHPDTRAADEAAFDLARAALMQGNLDDARLRLNRLVERLRTGEIAEAARFWLARVRFFAGEFDAAQSLLDVIDAHTSTDVSNDAIELKLLIMENRGPDSLDVPLSRYADALFAREQRRPQRALETVDALLADFPGHTLADEARYLRAEILRSIGEADKAAEAFAELPVLHPQSRLADRALFAAAEILERDVGDAEGAMETYQRLLANYPGSLLANQVRTRIRHLRGDGA